MDDIHTILNEGCLLMLEGNTSLNLNIPYKENFLFQIDVKDLYILLPFINGDVNHFLLEKVGYYLIGNLNTYIDYEQIEKKNINV